MTLILFLIVLAILVFVHEVGHFVAAKIARMRVDEFGIGFPPTIASVQKGETKYALNIIPLGGYVKIFGESPSESEAGSLTDSRSFVSKNRGLQAMVLIAGILFNMIFAWGLVSLGFMTGMPTASGGAPVTELKNPRLLVISLYPEGPAEIAGMKVGDELTFVGTPAESVAALEPQPVREFISSHPNEPILFKVKRGEEIRDISIEPSTTLIGGQTVVGISMDIVGIQKLAPHKAVIAGFAMTGDITVAVVKGIYGLIRDAILGRADFSQVAGPVGIAGLVGDASRLGFAYLISFTALISINLAVLNLVPFPALDGGRLLFVAIEAITRRKIPHKVANIANTIGFSLLILLMIVITYKDIIKLF
ncbi:MAG: hypothetical protein A2928_04255 [Candidatus Taylorbacteria bacterium RIFCSPLOWO2_01_FULL_45_15b]|uniref:PDZ domain-containing protein n=1 Tax=Candidatus Taylorbacteria bacterium RIFCSPLOWO2_01_FULL_45_15b TaxID=1802319 RepID=A0A1G2NEJ6_9BACT|nr:MAG: hypothetical protein A2928_04255 [Candidatus Taylorbacteria bacterium RIFCSPLOWO2_01_FULL_45_15b]